MTRHSHLGVSDFWLRRNPEYRLFTSREAMQDFSRTIGKKFGAQLGFRFGLFCVAPSTFPAILVKDWLTGHGFPWWLAWLALCGVTMVVSNCLFFLFMRRWSRRLLRRCLCEYGIPVCLDCGYDLRGDLDAGCPECGWGRDRDEAKAADGGDAP